VDEPLRLFPIDPIPDFIPRVELLDEMLVVPTGVLVATKTIPSDVFEECRENSREVAEQTYLQQRESQTRPCSTAKRVAAARELTPSLW
jgi:uncharacterized membrane protein YkvA (DUF1232 family)